jgi:hypothetical protein
MADKRITDLPLILSGDVTSTDVLPIVDVNLDITNKIEVDQLKSYILTGVNDFYVTGGTYSNGTITLGRQNGSVSISGLYTGETSYVNSLTTGTGLSADTTTGNVTIINTDPDQVVSISGGTNVDVTGTYPNFNIALTGLSDNNTYTTGTTISGNVVEFNRTDTQNAYDVNLSGITYTNIITSPTQIATNVDTTNDYLGITGSAVLSDEASNYGVVWTNGSNQGTGFNPWVISTQPNTGVFLGNPASDGMGTTGIGTNAFALFATDGSNYVSTSRTFTTPLSVGEVFSFYWVINFDANGGNKGFDLKAGGVAIFNANNNNTSTITSNLLAPYNVVDGGYGTTPMLVTLTRDSSTQYTITITSRSGGPTYSAPINSSLAVDELSFYCGAQSDGLGQRNLFFNKLQITQNVSLNKVSVDELKIALNVSTGLYSAGTGTDSTVRINTSNFANGNCSIVAGGFCNTSSGYIATVSGGYNNTSSGDFSTVSGGISNAAIGYSSTVGGGQQNTSSGCFSTVSGGQQNTSSGCFSTVSGGYQNKAKVDRSTIGGGQDNVVGVIGGVDGVYNESYLGSTLNGIFTNISPTSNLVGTGAGATFNFGFTLGVPDFATRNNIGEGYQNGDQLLFDGTLFGGSSGTDDVTLNVNVTDFGQLSTVSGGIRNTTSFYSSTVSGGAQNTANRNYATIGGGSNNISSGDGSFIGAGANNTISQEGLSIIGGGRYNTVSSIYGIIVGGGNNDITQTGSRSNIGGGVNNTISAYNATIGGGRCNKIDTITTQSGYYVFGSSIGGGSCNTISSYSAIYNSYGNTIAGGTCNVTVSSYSNGQTIGGGYRNTTSGNYSTVSGGYCNTSSGCVSTIGGGRLNTSSGFYSTVGGGRANVSSGECSVVNGGEGNNAGGCHSFIGGGFQNVSGINGYVTNVTGFVYTGGTFNSTFTGVIPTSTASGKGSNASFNFSFLGGVLQSVIIQFAGSGYVNGDTLYFNGNSFAGGSSPVDDVWITIQSTSDSFTTVVGGSQNTSSGYLSIVGAGYFNTSSGCYSFVGGGFGNATIGIYSIIGGGSQNTSINGCSAILGGQCNTAQHDCSFIVGSGICSTAANTTHMNCLNLKDIPVDPAPATLPSGTVYRCSTTGNILHICI